tara:strand:+ start:178 stop:285 length:108 start_codon:yes stop_codon:yes gene_type:complete
MLDKRSIAVLDYSRRRMEMENAFQTLVMMKYDIKP